MKVRLTNGLYWVSVLAALSFLLPQRPLDAQSYSKGQPVWPAYEGWEQDPDGSRYFLFGYMNENWEDEIDIPIGPDNSIQPGGPDRGQPTHFLPRRNRYTFRVPVPSGFGEKHEMVWTLTTHEKRSSAYATLRPDYFLDPTAKASDLGALGGGISTPGIRANSAPTLKVDVEKTLSARVGQPTTFVAWSTDDGQPATDMKARFRARQQSVRSATIPPWQITPNSQSGLWVSWFVYRGGLT